MSDAERWAELNHAQIRRGLAELRALLERHAGRGQEQAPSVDESQPRAHPSVPGDEASKELASARESVETAYDAIVGAFGLSDFEARLLLLCAAVELDASFAPLCADAQGDSRRPFATFSLALAALPKAHWSAIAPAAPLRAWHLIEVAHGDSLTTSALRISERVLHHLLGISSLEERLRPLLHAPEAVPLAPLHEPLVQRVLSVWRTSQETAPAILLCGADASAARAIAAGACKRAGAPLFTIDGTDVPAAPSERDLLRTLIEREALLTGCVLLVECDALEREQVRRAGLLVDELRCAVLASGREPLRLNRRARLRVDVPPLPPDEQKLLWVRALGEDGAHLNGELDRVVAHFRMGMDGIRTAAAHVRVEGFDHNAGIPVQREVLWNACRVQVRPRMDDLAERIEPAAVWEDLVLPPAQLDVLRQIAETVAQRVTVYERWGFAARGNRGLGISALFVGASGTGKTMAAEVLARSLRLDLYRIDLSQVVSKYIGETEKNLARVFDAAEQGGAVLLFDEADALFGKRSEVKDSHDRYANIEVSYLLQRMEAYQGLAILTTNMKGALDPAFLRRIRFVVQFPFPDQLQRAEIWRRVFPVETPTEGLDTNALARLSVAGGNIRNIALSAAFMAAAAGEPVRMRHLLRAARSEYAKLEKPLTDAEVAGWR